MSTNNGANETTDDALELLSERLDCLIDGYQKLREENRSLRLQLEECNDEQAQMSDKHGVAKERIASVISQLKSMATKP